MLLAGVSLDLPPLLPPLLHLDLPPLVPPGEAIEAKGKKGFRTYQPNVLKRKRTHGYLECAVPLTVVLAFNCTTSRLLYYLPVTLVLAFNCSFSPATCRPRLTIAPRRPHRLANVVGVTLRSGT